MDLSQHCTAFANDVGAMARGTGASLTHLHVLECPPPWYSDVDATLLCIASGSRTHGRTPTGAAEFVSWASLAGSQDLAPLRLLSQGGPTTETLQYAKG